MDAGDYDDLIFHRVFRGSSVDIIQSGTFGYENGVFVENVPGDPICNEPCIKNERGTIAMAKFPNQPNSATNQWFINVNDSPGIDPASNAGGFTVFGRVLEGMDVVDTIASLPARLPQNLILTVYLPFPAAIVQQLVEMPLTAELVEDPAGYGCFDTSELGVDLDISRTLIGPYMSDEFIPDPVTNSYSWISLACIDPMEPQPVVLEGNDCSADGNCILKRIFAENRFTTYNAVNPKTVTRSLPGRALLRDDMLGQLEQKSVRVTVPEPGATAAALGAIAALAQLARRRNPARS